MKLYHYLFLLVCCALPTSLLAQVESLCNIQLNQSLETVTQQMSNRSQEWQLISVKEPRFPLALLKEDHLVCTKVQTENGVLDRVVFTFADDTLTYIEAWGNVEKTLVSKRKDTALTYMDYAVYLKDRLFVNQKKDRAWILTEEAIHVNLFAWENPYLNTETTTPPEITYTLPAFLTMGKTLKELQPLLEAHSQFTQTEELDGSDPHAQLQINCYGVMYLGFPRKVEARFGDGVLNVVWILTGKAEEDRIRKALQAQFGDPVYVNEDWEIYNDWQVGLRKDKPEILLMEKKLGQEYKSGYFKQ